VCPKNQNKCWYIPSWWKVAESHFLITIDWTGYFFVRRSFCFEKLIGEVHKWWISCTEYWKVLRWLWWILCVGRYRQTISISFFISGHATRSYQLHQHTRNTGRCVCMWCRLHLAVHYNYFKILVDVQNGWNFVFKIVEFISLLDSLTIRCRFFMFLLNLMFLSIWCSFQFDFPFNLMFLSIWCPFQFEVPFHLMFLSI
jgi:hypothetical protein